MGVEKMLWEGDFLPLLFIKSKSFIPLIRALSKMPVKKSVLSLKNNVTSSNENNSFLMRKHRYYWSHDGGVQVCHRQSTSGAQGRKSR